ncbi:hypothetical protein [Spirosoma sp. KNUC1025]|uniref:hypothetical protein n=1 Tax=Spirosoma sp. KNUC1025 TaxID=2894082 RepID=UPI00386F10D4|nr:hypothetical protein LN737_25045 [Spirosoma sp. KNUC1025]
MNRFCRLIYLLFMAGFVLTCRQSSPEPDPFANSTPQLKSVTFSGIPQQNISIDQSAKTVSVRMPESVPNDIDITLELTDNAEWANKMTVARSSSLFGCDSCFHIYLKAKSDVSNSAIIDYRVKLISAAPLAVGASSTPLPYVIRNSNGSYLDIPMRYLYGNRLPRQARFTYDKTGEELVIKRDSAFSLSPSDQFRIKYGAYANTLSIYLFDEKLMPGSYHVDLILDDGTKLKVPQAVVVSPGTPDFDYEFASYLAYPKINFGYRVAAGNTLTIDGYNLFAGEVRLELVDGKSNVYPLSGVGFNRYGRQLQVPIPATLSLGQYVMRVWQNDIRFPYSYCLRVNVAAEGQNRPVIGIIGDEAAPCSLVAPVSVKRGVRVAFSSSLKQQVLTGVFQNATLKLTTLSGQESYYGTVVPFNVNRGWDPDESITLPATIPPGLYKAVLQVLDAQNNVVAESEPYGRLLEVK